MKQKVKNAEAVSLGKLRWKGKSKDEKSAHGKMMIDARWAKKKIYTPPIDKTIGEALKQMVAEAIRVTAK